MVDITIISRQQADPNSSVEGTGQLGDSWIQGLGKTLFSLVLRLQTLQLKIRHPVESHAGSSCHHSPHSLLGDHLGDKPQHGR